MTPCAGDKSFDNLIIVMGGAEETAVQIHTLSTVRKGGTIGGGVYHIDPWR